MTNRRSQESPGPGEHRNGNIAWSDWAVDRSALSQQFLQQYRKQVTNSHPSRPSQNPAEMLQFALDVFRSFQSLGDFFPEHLPVPVPQAVHSDLDGRDGHAQFSGHLAVRRTGVISPKVRLQEIKQIHAPAAREFTAHTR